jgi:hypothetical protein
METAFLVICVLLVAVGTAFPVMLDKHPLDFFLGGVIVTVGMACGCAISANRFFACLAIVGFALGFIWVICQNLLRQHRRHRHTIEE